MYLLWVWKIVTLIFHVNDACNDMMKKRSNVLVMFQYIDALFDVCEMENKGTQLEESE